MNSSLSEGRQQHLSSGVNEGTAASQLERENEPILLATFFERNKFGCTISITISSVVKAPKRLQKIHTAFGGRGLPDNLLVLFPKKVQAQRLSWTLYRLDMATSGNSTPTELTEDFSWPTVFILESLLILITNSTALLVFLKKSFLVKKSSFLIISLLVADFLVGISLLLESIDRLNKGLDEEQMFMEDTSEVTDSMITIAVYLSVFSLAAMAAERAYAIFLPLKHRLLERRQYLILIAFLWVLAVCVEIPLILRKLDLVKMGTTQANDLGKTLRLVFGGASLMVMFACYLSIWIKIRFCKPIQGAELAHHNAKLAKTLFIMTIVSLACFLPIGGLYIVKVWCLDCKIERYVHDALYIFVYCNSFFNFVVYSCRIVEFRRQLRRTFCNFNSCCRCCRRECCDINERGQHRVANEPSLVIMNTIHIKTSIGSSEVFDQLNRGIQRRANTM